MSPKINFPLKLENVRRDEQLLTCYCCSVEEIWRDHLKDEKHFIYLRYFNEFFVDNSTLQIECKTCKVLIFKGCVKDHALEHKWIPWYRPDDEFAQYFENFISNINDKYYCYLCDKEFQYWFLAISHTDEVKHRSKKEDKIRKINMKNLIPNAEVYEDCVKNNIFPCKPNGMECLTCTCYISGYKSIHEHINGVVHKKKFQQNSENLLPEKTETLKSCSGVKSKNELKGMATYKPKGLIMSIKSGVNGKNHKTESVDFGRVYYAIQSHNDFYKTSVKCYICKISLKSRVLLHIHLTGHLWKRFVGGDTELVIEEIPSTRPRLKGLSEMNKSEKIKESNPLDTMKYNLPESTKSEVTKDKVTKQSPKKFEKSKKEQKKVSEKRSSKKNGKENIRAGTLPPSPVEPLKLEFRSLRKWSDFETKSPRRFDIYEIDTEQLKIMKLSFNRCLPIDGDIYCLICRENVSHCSKKFYEHLRSTEHSCYLLEMLQDHSKFMSFPNQLSDLTLARHLMEEVSDDTVKCYACAKSIPNDTCALHEHVNDEEHKNARTKVAFDLEELTQNIYDKMERNWYNVMRYWCVPCRVKFNRDNRFYKHLTSSSHQKKKKIFNLHQRFMLDFCDTCATLSYSFRNTFPLHCECKMHNYYAMNDFYLVSKLPSEELLISPDEMITQLMESLDRDRDTEREKENILIDDLVSCIVDLEVEAHPFGSRISGLGTKSSDLDIFLDCDDLYYDGCRSNNVAPYIEIVEDCLKNNEDKWIMRRTVINCRIPIIKVNHKPTNIECDISFTNGLTVEKTKLIGLYNQKFPLCRKLILFMKQWVNNYNLGGEDGICSYALAWMVIFYLQMRSILPSVADLIKSNGKSVIIGGWETGVNKDFEVKHTGDTFQDLLTGLFEMCAQFDYRNEVLCPLLGLPLEKSRFLKPHEKLPREMKSYQNYTLQKSKDFNPEPFRIDSPMCIQDPFDLSNNLTKAMKKFMVYRFKKYCLLSAGKLNKQSIKF